MATDGIREGEVRCLLDEIQDLVEPTERRTMDGPAGPQRGRMPERGGQSHASNSPSPGESMGEPHAGERHHRMRWPDRHRSTIAERSGRMARSDGEHAPEQMRMANELYRYLEMV